ncbi:MAG: IS21 family transposase [Tissierellia bacterium]|nr:IS21 family transposase [Tissierellia bacterium]
MVITVKDYKEIRQMFLSGMSQRAIAKAKHISRNTVAKYCAGESVPWERTPPKRASTICTHEVIAFIQDCLDEDARENLKKQSHTAKRIFDRLVAEKGYTGGESTIRGKVRELKATLPRAFVPLAFSPGEAIQVDWGEAKVYYRGQKITVYLFCARLCSSCAPFVIAYRRQNEESFLDAFVKMFQFFGGAPEKVIFDNAKVAVKEGFGAHAKKQAGYTALSAHYGFDALFCNPAEGHEKGLVEGLVGWARRNILVPVPRVETMQELNELLLERCLEYHAHRIQGKPDTVGEMFRQEQEVLRLLPSYPFETAKCSHARVNAFATVRFATNDYSVPVTFCGREVSIKGYPEEVQIFSDGECIASHERNFGKHTPTYQLDHYLPLLERRGRAVCNAAPVRQNLPAPFLAWLKEQASDHKELMHLLRDCVAQGWENVWHHRLPSVQPVIQDVITVLPVDLYRYDELAANPPRSHHAG